MMRLFLGGLLSLGSLATASRVLIFDTDRPSSGDAAVPGSQLAGASAARNFIAHRLGLDQSRDIDAADVDSTIALVSSFAGTVQQPFDVTLSVKPMKALVVVDSVPSDSFLSTPPSAEFGLSNELDTPAITIPFLESLRLEAQEVYTDSKKSSPTETELSRQIYEEFQYKKPEVFVHEDVTLVYVSELTTIKDAQGADSPKYKTAAQKLQKSLQRIVASVSREPAYLTVVLVSDRVPTKDSSVSGIAGSANHRKSHPLKGDETDYEIDEMAGSVGQSKNKAGKSSTTKASEPTSTPTSTSLPFGAIPACFASLEDCRSGTNKCSNRGECVARGGSCFSCVCAPQVRTGQDGSKRTSYFAGRACQKEDVSLEFWLFAGFTLLAVTAVTGAVGLFWSLGQEDLPSIIAHGPS